MTQLNLSGQQRALYTSIRVKIRSIIDEGTHAEQVPDYREKGIPVSATEILGDGHQITHLAKCVAYDDRGQVYPLDWVIETNMDNVCKVIDELVLPEVPENLYLVVWHPQGDEPRTVLMKGTDDNAAWFKVCKQYHSDCGFDESVSYDADDLEICLDHVKLLDEMLSELDLATCTEYKD
ncbi:hypothetical protein HUO09_17620 [Vibrio sp. Y2-5]|uniref:hypothetical protein n=1 Tax=Vibrio sp. Y2-5 TaxID=2743977 RepID=UPI001660F189|nr:hypothetical protein [Vibrio sp. Y2-5]MBD0788177.1 hypothetical protein [Vibrio sp. Y2-5]